MSEQKDKAGTLVLQEVGRMTGLSEGDLDQAITEQLGASVNNLSMDQLRSVMLNYLETLNASIEEDLAAEKIKH